jgi:hypothetical protein
MQRAAWIFLLLVVHGTEHAVHACGAAGGQVEGAVASARKPTALTPVCGGSGGREQAGVDGRH